MRLPAPVRGLVRNENIAQSRPAGAYVLENWFPTATGIVTRRGKRRHATLSGAPVAAIMPYIFGASGKLFAADVAGIYDATNPVSATTPLSAVSGAGTVTNGNFSFVQFSTAGGNFLVCVNGENMHKVYDGSAWAENTPAITGTTSNNFNHVWSYKNRLYFIRKDSLKFAYLPVNSIGGAAVDYDLGSVFKHGGYLVTGATWSSDAGDNIDDLCVFITSEGEVAVYAGDDPSDPARWSIQGVYLIGKPLGKMALFRAGGDLGIATRDGLVPLSGAYAKATEALRDTAVSKAIEELWTEYTAQRNTLGWHIQPFTNRHSMLWVAPPTISGQQAQTLVANMRTGAWTTYTGYNVRSMGVINAALYVGEATGIIYEAESGGTDDGATYTARAAGLWDDLRAPMGQKRVTMLRGTFRSNLPTFSPLWSIGTDYTNRFPADPSAGADVSSAVWGSSVWGSSTWGGGNQEYRTSQWASVEGVGHMISWQLQVTLGNAVAPDIELASVGAVYEVGETLA
jgi:hypothetical protein